MAIITVTGIVGYSNFKYDSQGKAVLMISVADRRYNFRTKEEETFWIRAVWFGERAEKLSDSLLKAKIVSIVGKENYEIYNDKIDRTIFPLEHSIIQFKSNEDTDQPRTNINDDYSYPPLNDDDIPFL